MKINLFQNDSRRKLRCMQNRTKYFWWKQSSKKERKLGWKAFNLLKRFPLPLKKFPLYLRKAWDLILEASQKVPLYFRKAWDLILDASKKNSLIFAQGLGNGYFLIITFPYVNIIIFNDLSKFSFNVKVTKCTYE